MIAILGRRCVALLGLLLISCVLLATYYMMVVRPLASLRAWTLQDIRTDVVKMEKEAGQLRKRYAQFEINRHDYVRLEEIGFFEPQDRLKVRQRFETIQGKSGVRYVRYTLNPAQIEDNKALVQTGSRLVKTTMTLTIEADDDRAIYHFLHLMAETFPGRIDIARLAFARQEGQALVRVEASVDWYNLVAVDALRALMRRDEALRKQDEEKQDE